MRLPLVKCGRLWSFVVAELQNKLLRVIYAHPRPKMQPSFEPRKLSCVSAFAYSYQANLAGTFL